VSLDRWYAEVQCVYVADGEVDWLCNLHEGDDYRSAKDFRPDWTTFADLMDVMTEHWAHYHRDSV
jgi:hypothetical protein